jgi:hypothetical protein
MSPGRRAVAARPTLQSQPRRPTRLRSPLPRAVYKRCTRDAPGMHKRRTLVHPWCISGTSLVHLMYTACSRGGGGWALDNGAEISQRLHGDRDLAVRPKPFLGRAGAPRRAAGHARIPRISAGSSRSRRATGCAPNPKELWATRRQRHHPENVSIPAGELAQALPRRANNRTTPARMSAFSGGCLRGGPRECVAPPLPWSTQRLWSIP